MSVDINWLEAGAALLLILSCIRGYQRGFVKEVASAFFVVLALALVWMINPYISEFLQEKTPVYRSIQEQCREILAQQTTEGDAGERELQGEIIRGLPLPGSLKDGIAENNNSEVYHYLAVHTFSDYLSGYLAKILCNGISFLLSYFLATLSIRAVVYALDLIARLPVIHGINRFAGIFVGGVRGLFFLWVAFLVITIFCSAPWGRAAIGMIEQSSFLSYLYRKDIFVDIFMNIFYGK